MGSNMKDSGTETSARASALRSGPTEPSTSVSGKTTKRMEKENFSTSTEMFMTVSGKMTKRMGMDSILTLNLRRATRGIGTTTCDMVLESSSMLTATDTKACSSMEKGMDMALIIFSMVLFMKESG